MRVTDHVLLYTVKMSERELNESLGACYIAQAPLYALASVTQNALARASANKRLARFERASTHNYYSRASEQARTRTCQSIRVRVYTHALR